MLYPYTFVPHTMDKMQSFIDFIFYAVWCKARHHREYGLHLFAANAKLYSVMFEFHYSDTKIADFFNKNIELIHKEFKKIPPHGIRQIKQWYKGNNNIELICSNEHKVQVAKYADIQKLYPDLEKSISIFFRNIYDNLNSAALKKYIGNIDSHYDEFISKNDEGKCPFCGINDLLGEYNSKREAYDHYLPKVFYPFNSINFRNLVPACHHCNSSYKGTKDPAYKPKDPLNATKRRVAFYPFKKSLQPISLEIKLKHIDIKKLTPKDITLHFGPNTIAQEIETWKDVYGIEERYKDKLCRKNDGKAWVMQVLDEWKNRGHDPKIFLTSLESNAKNYPLADCNFLKKPFFDALEKLGLF